MTQTQTRSPRLSPEAGRSPDAVAGVQQILKSVYAGGVPRTRWSWSTCGPARSTVAAPVSPYGIKSGEETGLTAERLIALPGWRESASFDDAERAALAPNTSILSPHAQQ